MLEKMIDSNERLMWQGKPDRLLYTIGNLVIYPIAAVWLVFDLFFIRRFISFPGFGNGGLGFMTPFLTIFFAFHLLPVWIAVFGPIYRFFSWTRVEYAVTTRRIYLQSGLIGRDYTSIELYEVQNLSVNVGVLERMRNCGSVRLTPDVSTGSGRSSSTRSGHRLKHIAEPYDVYNLIKRLALDITTDKHYPNELRPQQNPGYSTEYRGSAGQDRPER